MCARIWDSRTQLGFVFLVKLIKREMNFGGGTGCILDTWAVLSSAFVTFPSRECVVLWDTQQNPASWQEDKWALTVTERVVYGSQELLKSLILFHTFSLLVYLSPLTCRLTWDQSSDSPWINHFLLYLHQSSLIHKTSFLRWTYCMLRFQSIIVNIDSKGHRFHGGKELSVEASPLWKGWLRYIF